MQSNEVLSEETCDLIWDRCHREIIKGETKHLIVLSSVPIAYPRVVCILRVPLLDRLAKRECRQCSRTS